MLHLKISDDHRFIVHADGSPFFYLGDTAWELFHRLDRDEAEHYLTTRAAQGYNVIQCVTLAEFDGLRTPNPYGQIPLLDNDPTHPNEAYFQHVDDIIHKTNDLGMVCGLLPTWGDKWNNAYGAGPLVFTPANALFFGRYLGERYRDRDLIWIMGGDRAVDSPEQLAILRAMAQGIREGDGGSHLMTFHPRGDRSSSDYVHNEPWLDFNMFQSGHSGQVESFRFLQHDYALTPTKPALDGEPAYEDHPIMQPGWKPAQHYFTTLDIRRRAWWSVLAGAAGHTYGCHDIWQFLDTARNPVVNNARTPWRDALYLPAAQQMQHVKNLMLSLNWLQCRPADHLLRNVAPLAATPQSNQKHACALASVTGDFAIFYLPEQTRALLDLCCLKGKQVQARWYDPRTGTSTPAGTHPTTALLDIASPTDGPEDDQVFICSAL